MLDQINYRKIPAWVCETHLRELDDLLTSGERQEAYEVLTDLVNSDYVNCDDCLDLRASK